MVLQNTLVTMPLRPLFLTLLSVGLFGLTVLGEATNRDRRLVNEERDNLVFKSEDHPDQKKPSARVKLQSSPVIAVEVRSTQKRPVKKILSPPAVLGTEPPEYRLKPGDRIEVSVWGEDMTRELMVGPDGRISYILVGELNVLNMSFKELKTELQEKLDSFLIDPNVSVIGLSYEGNYVSILGAVKNPGRIVIAGGDRLIDVLARAGGLRFEEFGNNQGEIANLANAYLSREGKMVPVDFSRLLYEGDMTQNVRVEIGDFIYIPSSVGQPIYVTGEVNTPTSVPFRGKPTLLDAIAEANGFNNQGQKNKIYLVRGGMVNPQIVTYSFYKIVKGKMENPFLDPGDIIYVPPTTITRIERLSAQIIPFLNVITSSKSAKDSVQEW